ncbi:uncharacterized protein LOC143224669 isoform X2 [Tachypleus tridentatus]|uniref:uncharacterized protein LOC143224669 isoform X2 n=1 Tax=Tachypleus tridentatus TaxID=6853 RepID=UPI003FCF279B
MIDANLNESDDDDNAEKEEEEELDPSEKLEILTAYLRSTHFYCVWCGTAHEGESWPINDTIWNEQEEPVPSGIFIPKSGFALKKISLKKRIQDGLKSVFGRKHQYKPHKQERIRGITDPLDQTESWCHDFNDNEEIEIDSSLIVDYPTGRVIKFQEDGKRVVETVKSKNKPYGFCIAKKMLKNSNVSGVFITRMRNYETFISLTGILDPGDEILEIDGVSVSQKHIIDIQNMIINTKKIRFTTLSLLNLEGEMNTCKEDKMDFSL